MALVKPPKNKRLWRDKAKIRGVENKSIYDLAAIDSGSKIGEVQYLALRGLWISRNNGKFDASKVGIRDLDDARKWLNNRPDWQNYLNELEKPPSSVVPVEELGSFSFVCLSRRQISGVRKVDDVDKIHFTPWVSKLRPRRNETKGTGYQAPSPEQSPTVPIVETSDEHQQASSEGALASPLPGLESLTLEGDEDDDEDDEDEDEDEEGDEGEDEEDDEDDEDEGDDEDDDDHKDEMSSDHRVTPRTARVLYPDVEDEQIVNTFLVALLSCLSFHSDGVKSEWSPLRKALNFGKGKKQKKKEKKHIFQARTDGHLFLSGSVASTARSSVILEVKPTHRDLTNKVVFQATAQMAAWIYSEPDGKLFVNKFRRPMIIQERNEIRIVIAEYDADYVKYIGNTSKKSAPLSFLNMNEYGPWNIENRNQMEELGPILLALTRQNGKLV